MKPNTILLIIAIFLFITGMFAGCFVQKNFIAKPCDELIKTDTVVKVIHDSITVVQSVKSKPRKVVKSTIAAIKIDSIHCDTLRLITRELVVLADTCYYSDTLRNDTSYHIVVSDTIIGSRIGFGIEFKNLRPMIERTVTNTVRKKKQWVVYGAVQIPISKDYVSAIPTAIVTTPVGFCFGYGYDGRRNEHLPQIGYSIRFGAK